MPSSGRIAAISCIPPVRVEPIPPLDDMASQKIYCRRELLMKNGVIDREKGSLEARLNSIATLVKA